MKISPARLSGVVRAIPSKSQAHRALISAALADRPTEIVSEGGSDDITATADCLAALGAVIEKTADGFFVSPVKRAQPGTAVLPCRESGSTLRFLLPVAAALGYPASFMPQGRLPQRPLSPLYGELLRHGCTLSPEGAVPFTVAGQLLPGGYTLNAGVSSQFISGLLFALPLLKGDSELQLTGQAESFSYVGMTLAMLQSFGIRIETDGTLFSVAGGQTYRSPGVLQIEGDWSNAAFWLSAGAIGGGGVTCTGLDFNSRQGDRAIVDILARLGAKIERTGSTVSAAPGKLRGAEIDARDIPDLVPILAVVCAVSEGTSIIRGAGRLRMKESDRLLAITSVLRTLGADMDETEDGLIIRGGRALGGGNVSSFRDHRIAMAAAVAASVSAKPVIIGDVEAVSKSYPGFFGDFSRLGGAVQITDTDRKAAVKCLRSTEKG